MARKTSTLPTRNWTFSARIASSMDAAIAVLRTSNRYYNALVEIERHRHMRYTEIRNQHAPELATIDAEWQSLDEQIRDLYRQAKADRQAHWRESGGERSRRLPDAFEARKAALVERQKVVSASGKEHRAVFAALVDPARTEYKRRAAERATGRGPRTKAIVNGVVLAEMLAEPVWHAAWKQIAESDEAAHAATLAARAACGLYAGTYLVVEEAFGRAKADSAPAPPRFRRFDGQGKIAVQLRKGTTWGTLSGDRLRVEPIDRRTGVSSRTNMMRLTFDQSRNASSNLIEATTKMHRLPPDDAEVKWASLLFRRVGRRTVVQFQLTMEHASFGVSVRPAGLRSAEHVLLGWSRVDGGVRVAHWPGSDVVCPSAILAQRDHAASIESARDRLVNEAVRRLRGLAWLSGHRLTSWHRATSDQWRPTIRRICVEFAGSALGDLPGRWHAWRVERKARREDLYAPVRVLRCTMTGRDAVAWWAYLWARKDEHLERYAADSRLRFVNRRDAHYRAEAIRIATEFEAVTIDKFSIAELKKLDEITLPGAGMRDMAQSQLQAAAPGRFRELLLEVMGPRCTACERPRDALEAPRARKRKAS